MAKFENLEKFRKIHVCGLYHSIIRKVDFVFVNKTKPKRFEIEAINFSSQ
jgi:hypothetical protein